MSHQCFRRGCTVQVDDQMLACPKDWNALSVATRQEIHATVGLNLLDPIRQAALRYARSEWESRSAGL